MNYTKDILEPLVATSNSYSDVVRKLGKKVLGSNVRTISKKIKQFGLDTSHMTHKRPANFIPSTKQNWQHFLIKLDDDKPKSTNKILRRCLLELNIIEKCVICNINPLWNGKHLRLHIDHINGDSHDNRPNNLRFLCPNCHQQTATWGNTKVKKHKVRNKDTYFRKVLNKPSKEELNIMLWEIPTSKIAKKYGVSDKAIEKWAKLYELNKPPRGYWAKRNSM